LCRQKFQKGKIMAETLGLLSLYIHITAGILTLFSGPLAIFYNFKNPTNHRIAGKTFFYAMLVVVVTSVTGFLKRPDVVFFQFLLGISMIVFAGIMRGVRAIFLMKGARVIPFDFVYTALLGLTAIVMLGMSAWHFRAGTMIAFPILFGVFGVMSLSDTWQNWKIFTRPQLLHRLDWMRLHSGTMLGAFTASTTAFTVNAAHFLPWWAQWFGPTLLLLPLQVYFGRKLKLQRDRVLSASPAV
jgi:hypothetical protein